MSRLFSDHVLFFMLCLSFWSCMICGEFRFRNVSLSWEERVEDLVNRLTLDEMVQQMANGGGAPHKPCPAIPRLGIKPYNFNTECLRGILNNPSTGFPQAIGLSATFSAEIVYDVASAIAKEARAIFNNASAHGDYDNQKSISCLAPFINIMRHPLWGRVQEVYGECPYLSGRLAAAYVHGLQGNHSRYVVANAGCKVVAVHSGPENIPSSRFSFNSIVSERDLRLTYLPNFKACIEAGSFNLMCSYNSINGVPACANKRLLKDILRDEFGFKGYYISDEGAVENIYTEHKYVNSTLEAAAAAVNAGVNIELPPKKPAYFLLTEAVNKGLVAFETIVDRVKPLFYTRMKLGEFDPPKMNPFTEIGMDVVQSKQHRDLAIKTAAQTYVLLKNDNNFLPIKEPVSRMAVIGPMTDNVVELFGDYSPIPVPRYVKTPLVALFPLAWKTSPASGCDNNLCKNYDTDAVRIATDGADLVVVCLGAGSEVEFEGRDRSDMELPGKQFQLILDAQKYAPKASIILLLFTAGPMNISYAKQAASVVAIIQCWYPGQAAGDALYRIMSDIERAAVSPSARLPYTWPLSLDQVPSMVNYSMENRTYRYFSDIPLYPFGYGLSYSRFQYTDLRVPSTIQAGTAVSLAVNVTNLGPYTAEEVVQVYISWVKCSEKMPQIQLVGVQRINLEVKDMAKLTFTITAEQLQIWNDKMGFIHHYGLMYVWVGGQQPMQETKAPSNVLKGQFLITK